MDKRIHKKIAREQAVIALYQNLLTDCSMDELHQYLESQFKEETDDLDFSLDLLKNVFSNKEQYILLINKYLKEGWSFDRLAKMEQSILLIATSELLETDLPKEIIINEAIIITKKYCDASSYKYINAVLGKIN